MGNAEYMGIKKFLFIMNIKNNNMKLNIFNEFFYK